MWINFAFLDPNPDPQSGSRDPIESGSNPDPDPKHCQKGSDPDYLSGLESTGPGPKYIILTSKDLYPTSVKVWLVTTRKNSP